MSDVRSTWNETGEHLSALGASLKTHYQQQRGSDGEQTRAELNDAVRKLTSAVQDAFEAVGAAAKDPEVKDEVKKVGQSVQQALGATFSEVSEELRKTFNQRKGEASAGSASSAAAEPPSTAAGSTEPAVSAPGSEAGEAREPQRRDDGQEPPRVEPWGTP